MLLLLCLVASAFAAKAPGGFQQQRYGRPQPQPFVRPQIQPQHFGQRPSLGGRPNLGVAPVQPVQPVQPIVGPSGSQDCVTQPGQWSQCSAPCGGGIRKRSLVVVRQPTGYGAKCPALHEETENCNSHPCPIDCEVEQGQYSQCSETCGTGGFRTKIDIIIREAKYGGRACPSQEQLRSTIPCQNLPPCPVPVHCEIAYTQYTACSATCGVGFKSRNAYIVQESANGGAPCPTDLSALSETVTCNEAPCAEVYDCLYIEGSWGQCSADCGQGYRKKRIYIIAQPSPGGAPCPSPSQLEQQEPCNAGPCQVPIDCKVEWGYWSYCTKTCGGGTQSLTGKIVQQASYGGIPCPAQNQLHVTRTCNDATPCQSLIQKNCEVVYGPYSQCSAPCDGGYRYQKGWIKSEPTLGGLACPAPSLLEKREPCNTFPCAPKIDCEVQRSYYSECSRSCGGGTQSRTVKIIKPAQGGIPCPTSLYETRSCNNEPCF